MGRLLLLLALTLAVAGCGDNGEDVGTSPPTTETVPTGTEPTPTGPDLAAECTSEEGGYTVSYPEGWHQQRCAYFDPEPFEVPEATEFLDVAVLVSREPIAPAVLLGEDPTREVIEQEETRVGGREAVRMEAETTGQGLLDRGIRFYQVAIAADGESVILSTYDLGDLDYERNKQVVDELADRLELTR